MNIKRSMALKKQWRAGKRSIMETANIGLNYYQNTLLGRFAMFKLLNKIFRNQYGGLGCTQASLVSAIADRTGDDSADAIVKIRRLINEEGPNFCMIANWPFLRSDITFTLSTSDWSLSGASYLPTTFKRVVAAYLLSPGGERYDIDEVGIQRAHQWMNPTNNPGTPSEFCITRMESGYWETQFDRLADQAYVFYGDIELQWTNLTTTTSETLITLDYYGAFSHYVAMARAVQQGDTELFAILDRQWFDSQHPQKGILTRIMASIRKPMAQKSVQVSQKVLNPTGRSANDYSRGVNY